jgi:hypothetical protein
MLECKRDEITDIGFIDPETMHVRTIEEPLYNRNARNKHMGLIYVDTTFASTSTELSARE